MRMVPWKEKDMKVILKDGQYLERRKGDVFRLIGETITTGIRYEMDWPDGGISQEGEPNCFCAGLCFRITCGTF